MKISEEIVGDVVIFQLNCRIGTAESLSLLRDTLHKYVELGKRKIILDLTKAELYGNLGLGALVLTRKTMSDCGGEVKLANLSEKIKEIMVITQLVKAFEIYDSVEEAVDSFKD